MPGQPSDREALPVTGSEIVAGARAAGWVGKLLRRPDPVERLKRRTEVKAEIRERLYAKDANWGDPPEILVIQLGKEKAYGNAHDPVFRRGASKWAKLEVRSLGDRGLVAYLAWEYVQIKKGTARTVRGDVPGAEKVLIVGILPYERIEFMEWEPDPDYGAPRFHVRYTWRNEIFESVAMLRKFGSGDGDYFEDPQVKYIGDGRGPIKAASRYAMGVGHNIASRWHERQWRRDDSR